MSQWLLSQLNSCLRSLSGQGRTALVMLTRPLIIRSKITAWGQECSHFSWYILLTFLPSTYLLFILKHSINLLTFAACQLRHQNVCLHFDARLRSSSFPTWCPFPRSRWRQSNILLQCLTAKYYVHVVNRISFIVFGRTENFTVRHYSYN